LKFGKSQKNEENTLAQINGIKRMRKRIEAYAKILKNITSSMQLLMKYIKR
jgi:hypothetical protein